jgi:Tfp pilus assembly protein PilF
LIGAGGGDPKLAEYWFQRALKYDAHNKPAMSFYADLLIEKNRKAEARKMLEQLIADPVTPEWAPEENEFKRSAIERLNKLK